MQKEVICPQEIRTVGPYSPAVLVNQHLLLLSGQLGIEPASGKLVGEDVKSQTEQALKNLLALVKEAGGTVQNVARVTLYLTDMNDFAEVNEVYGVFFQEEPLPARVAVGVSTLPLSAKIEIEAMAIL